MMEFQYVTTEAAVAIYDASSKIFAGILSEMRELSKKKPDTTLNKHKVKVINRVLIDLQSILKEEPEGKYLDLLDDDELPQNSDAVLVMVQYEKALNGYRYRYHDRLGGELVWITEEAVREWQALEDE